MTPFLDIILFITYGVLMSLLGGAITWSRLRWLQLRSQRQAKKNSI